MSSHLKVPPRIFLNITMYKFTIEEFRTNLPFFSYFFSTLFMVFFSVQAIHNWPDRLSQIAISSACILTTLLVLQKHTSELIHTKKWLKETKIVFIIMALGAFNIYFSEDRSASLKGMSLFLMSGILIFFSSFFLFQTRKNQKLFLWLCSLCFATLIIYGLFEFFQKGVYPEKRILLLATNPIPAGSLLILLATGPLLLLIETRIAWQKLPLSTFLLVGVLVVFLIGQRGPILALLVMGFIWAATRKRGAFIFSLIIIFLMGAGYLFRGEIPSHYTNQLLKKETILVRLEFYNVAWQVIQDKPFFGVGFNTPVRKYVPQNYKPLIYPADSKYTFPSIITGTETFDNMALFFLGQTGLLFSGAYGFLIIYLILNLNKRANENAYIKPQSILLLIVLIGFTAHSMTFDSLRYPQLNWLFHSLLGLIANCSLLHQEQAKEGFHPGAPISH